MRTPSEDLERSLHALMLRYQAGDVAAFEDLYRQLAPSLRRYLVTLSRNPQVADDLLQDTFLQLHRSRRTFTPSRPIRPWAFAIARHVFQMDRRTKRRRPLPREGPGELLDIPVPPAVEAWADRERVRRALGDLPTEQAETVLLHHLWGFSFEEIGKMLGIRAGAARVRASRALRALRERLSSQ